MKHDKVYIIGMGDDGRKSLGARALELIRQAELLFGGKRHLEFFNDMACEKVTIKSNLKEIAARIKSELGKKKMVVLASGDPLFYGIGKYLCNVLSKNAVEITPFVSSMQMAFAKVKESWEDACFVSVHARPMDELLSAIQSGDAKKIGIFTDDKNTPDRIARKLLENNFNHFYAYVCENLGGKDERVVSGSLKEIAGQQFAPLNVMILVKRTPEFAPEPSAGEKEWTLGIPDLEFYQRTPEKGLITKCEVRVLSLSKMCLQKNSVVWDIGAGSGSVSIESALMAPEGKVYAVEKNEVDFQLIQKNIEKFGAANVIAIHGTAPECLSSIPDDPDAVFVGGSAGSMHDILRVCAERLKEGGRIVVNVVTLENLAAAWDSLRKLKMKAETILIQVSRSQPILNMTRLAALNPVYIISASNE